MKQPAFTALAFVLVLIGSGTNSAFAHPLSPDTGVINVKDHGAVGDGKADDTEALRVAVKTALDRQGRYSTPPFVYLPAGTYRVTGPIAGKISEHGWSGGWRAGLILWGEDRERTVIKLDDNLSAYSDPQKPQYVLATGSESDKRTKPGDKPLSGGGNRAFRHSILNLTIDVGKGNPGAVGIDYVANNRGAIENVTIRSSDPERIGHTGLKLTRNWPGPCLYKDLTIEGFDRGIEVSHNEYGNVFENITLRGQRVVGLANHQNMLAMRKFVSENTVPAIHAKHSNGLIVVVEGSFTGGSKDHTAVMGVGELYLRDLTVEGYGMAVDVEKRKGAKDVPMAEGATTIDLYTTESFAMGYENASPLRLPIKDTPLFWSDNKADWVSPQLKMEDPENNPGDWTTALQAALDDGRPVVYLPNGGYRVSKTLTVPPHVRLLIGFQSSISVGKDNKDKVDPLLRFVGNGGKGTTVEHLWISGHVEHAADRAVAFRHVDLHGRYRNTKDGTGDLFIEDTIGPKPLLVEHPQHVFARQLNIEFGAKPLIENHGGTLWLLGYKTEGEMVCLQQTAGTTELLGALLYPLRKVQGGTPAFLLSGGDAALTYAMSGPKYPNQVRNAVRNGQQTLTAHMTGGRSAALVRVRAGDDVPPVGLPVEKDVTDDGGVVFWKKSAADEGGGYTSPDGSRWTVVALGSRNSIDSPDGWTPLKWNEARQRWEGEKMSDQAPSYARRNRTLRGRGSQGKLVGFLFQPANAGTYRITGQAKVDTWGPDGPIDVSVHVVGADNNVRSLLKKTFEDWSEINWEKHPELQTISLAQSDRLLLTFSSVKGGTASLELAPYDKPTSILPVQESEK